MGSEVCKATGLGLHHLRDGRRWWDEEDGMRGRCKGADSKGLSCTVDWENLLRESSECSSLRMEQVSDARAKIDRKYDEHQ